MSEFKIKRRSRYVSLTLHSTTALATTLRMDDFAGAAVSLGTMSTDAASLQVFGSHAEEGPYRRVYGADGSAADITLAPSTNTGRVYSLPDAAFAVPFLKIVSAGTNSTGTQGVVMFKS
jgi:hypothetical protein